MTEPTEGAAPEAVTEDAALATTEGQVEAQGQDDLGDDAAAAGEDGEGDQPKIRKSPQERINEVTKARREAERQADQARRDAEYWREQALRSAPQPQPQAQQPAEAGEPDPSDYEYGTTDARYIEDRAVYRARKAIQAENAQAEANRARSQQLSAFETAAQAEADKHPDFYEVVGRDFGRAAAVCTPVMSDALIASQDGPTLAYHLAKNPAEARRISALPPIAQAVELGKLSQKLATPPAPTPKTATDAPAPTPQVRGAGGRFKPAPDTDDFAAFDSAY